MLRLWLEGVRIGRRGRVLGDRTALLLLLWSACFGGHATAVALEKGDIGGFARALRTDVGGCCGRCGLVQLRGSEIGCCTGVIREWRTAIVGR